MKIAVLCDLHLSDSKHSPQYHFLASAVDQLRKDGIQTVLTLGDISACGELEALQNYYALLEGFSLYTLLGNSDIRSSETKDQWMSAVSNFKFNFYEKTVLGINNPRGSINEDDRKEIEALHNGDILAMHHGIRALDTESQTFFRDLAQRKRLTILNAHHHRFIDEEMDNFRMITFRALDPDKAIGNFPSITYLDVMDGEISLEEKLITISPSIIKMQANFSEYPVLTTTEMFRMPRITKYMV